MNCFALILLYAEPAQSRAVYGFRLIRKHNLKIVPALLSILGLLIENHEKIKAVFIKTLFGKKSLAP